MNSRGGCGLLEDANANWIIRSLFLPLERYRLDLEGSSMNLGVETEVDQLEDASRLY